MRVDEHFENGNNEIAYDMVWSGKGYSDEEAGDTKKAIKMYG
jgi:hypothetical protein